MDINPRGEGPTRLAARLVNDPVDNPRELQRVCEAAGVIVERAAVADDVTSLNQRLQEWERLADEPSAEMRIAMMNRMLIDSAVGAPILTQHDNQPLHLHYRQDGIRFWEAMHAMILMGTALHFITRGPHRLGRCESPECHRVYVDTSRPGTQRFCSTACANRQAVRRHRGQN